MNGASDECKRNNSLAWLIPQLLSNRIKAELSLMQHNRLAKRVFTPKADRPLSSTSKKLGLTIQEVICEKGLI
ncbi:uncharacterized protein J3R85_008802 [Psidium guajava]|nr:uncharacterized protein J3R85_008802 [Psidium guajava]